MVPRRVALGLLVLVALWSPGRAGAASEGTGLYVGPTALPWVQNQVTVDVAFGLARGEVRQQFWNNTGRPVEAIYVFALPTGAAVTAMSMEVGGQRIDATIARRAAAQATYERAIAGGQAAALTERERPGVYTQSVAGIPVDGTVIVILRWSARLDRHQGEWELAHPLVVGPRYTPGMATGAPTVGAGLSPDTERAPDASRVTPPRDRAASVGFVVTATLHGAGAVSSPTHTLKLGSGDDAVIASIDDPRGNRELVLRWRRAGLQTVRALAETTGSGTYVAVLIEPPPAAAPSRRTGRSWLVAIDRSASMQGASGAAARRLARAVIASLGPDDRAAVVAIGDRPRWLGADLRGRAALDRQVDALGLTSGDLTAGLATSLARLPTRPPAAVVLITDGLVADDGAAIARATAAGAVIHPVGVGAAPNRWLLEAVAAGTGGTAHVVIDPDDAESIAAEVVAAADAEPVRIDWRRPSVTDAEPARAVVVPGGAALIIAVDPSGAAGVAGAEVEVLVGGQRVRAPIEIVHGSELATEWARRRITELEARGQGAAATQLALERGLVSTTTALVAVAAGRGEAIRSTVSVPLPLPAGQRPESLTTSAGDAFDDLSTDGIGDGDAPRGGAPTTGVKRAGTSTADVPAKAPPSPTPPRDRATADAGPVRPADARDQAGADDGVDSEPARESDDAEVAGRPATPTVADNEYAAVGGSLASEQILVRSRLSAGGGRRGLTVTVGLGARLDDRGPAGQLGFGFGRRVARTEWLAGLRLELTAAPAAERPLAAATLFEVARRLGLLTLDAGLGPWFDGRLGVGYGAGLSFRLGSSPLSFGARLAGAATSGRDPVAVTGGVTVGF